MPVANSEKVRRRKEDMSWDELGCYSSHSRTSTAASLRPNDNISTPTSSSRRNLRHKSSIHNHPSSAPGRPSSGLNEYLANGSNGGGVLPTPPPFGGSSRSIFSRNSTATTPPASPRPGRRRSRFEERSSSLTDNSSYHSRVSRSKSPIQGRTNHSRGSRSKSPIQGRSSRSRGSTSKSPIHGRAKFSSIPDLPSIGEKKKSKTKKKVQRDSSKSPISARKKFTKTDIPPPPPPPPSFDSPSKTPRKTKKSPISEKRKKATQSPASTRKSKEDSDAKPISNLSSSSDNKPLSGASIPAPKKVVMPDGKTVLVQEVPMTKEEAELLNNRQDKSAAFQEMKDRKGWGGSNLQPMANIQVEKRPPRTLIIIWLLMAGELGFDLATTWIAFATFLGGENCCGYEIELGPLPLSATVPFLILVLAEMTLLGRAIFLTLWPSQEYKHDEENQNEETRFQKNLHSIMCFLKWNAKVVLRAINLCTVINPFLSCLVAWVLMYEGDRTEALVVLGLEAGGIIMHMMAVYMEGACKSRKMFLFHSLPIIPFIITVSLCLVYLKNGGVCYLVGNKVFNFHGCEVCEEDGTPPIDGMCGNTTVSGGGNILDNLLGDITTRTLQGTYCAGPDDPDGTNFCFYSY